MTPEKILEDQIIMTIKTVEDPEIPVNIYNLESVNKSEVTITFDPTWDKSYMSEEAKLELGML